MFSWSIQASADSTATPERMWEIWSDVTSWTTWDETIEWCKTEGMNTQSSLKIKTNEPSFRLTYVDPYKKYKDIARHSASTVELEYDVVSLTNDQSIITIRISVKGLLAPYLRFSLKPKLEKDLSEAVANFAKMADRLRP